MSYEDYDQSEYEWIREFDPSTNENELEWHRDKNDRHLEVLEGTGWLFQFDNGFPFYINISNTVFIPKETFHRLHKGDNKLKIKIKEYSDDV